MAFTNHEEKVIHFKITYWGPHLGGKTTSIAYISSKTSGQAWEPEEAPFFQLNKQDLPDALEPELLKEILEIGDDVAVPTSAIQGPGVFDALKAAARICMEKFTG